ncbi:hypothetical protein JR338_08080 [Chloroflexota bacterium]|nr:hypothetical protein JR338_08080 [Chloroflexota bacterium]
MRTLKHLNSYSLLFIAAIIFIFLFGGIVFPSVQPQVVEAQTVSTCLNRVNIPTSDLHWAYVPETADQLYTEEKYYYLAGQLIANGVVDASTCPSNGLMSTGYANACGMSEALPTVIIVQNLLNEPILQAYDDVGVPPVILKLLIGTESQFWPSSINSIHFGYGHLTNMGIRNAVQWNSDLYNQVCPSGTDCVASYSIADQILASLVDTCPTCEYGIDTTKASRSVNVLAESLLGYCYQTEQLIYNATGWYSGYAVDYATIWKLTLMDYNAGSQCVYNTLESTFDYTQGPMRWSDISAHVSGDLCIRGWNYANTITSRYFDFPPTED